MAIPGGAFGFIFSALAKALPHDLRRFSGTSG